MSEPLRPVRAEAARAQKTLAEPGWADATAKKLARDVLALVAELDRAETDWPICSWCGEEWDSDTGSSNCCSSDPASMSSLPGILQDARREAQEAIDEGFETDKELLLARAELERAEGYLKEIKKLASDPWASEAVALRACLLAANEALGLPGPQPSPERDIAMAVIADLKSREAEQIREAEAIAVRRVVERYGRVWAKDNDYYRAAEILGIKEPPDA